MKETDPAAPSKNAVTRRKRRRALRTNGTLPRPTLERLTEYLVILDQCLFSGKKTLSSTELSDLYGNTPSQVRQDIFQLPGARRSGQGYSTRQLASAIRSALGLDKTSQVAIIGCGRIGLGLACNVPFSDYGMTLSAIFDVKPDLVGTLTPAGVAVSHTDEIGDVIRREGVSIAMITVPDSVAQEMADKLVEAGVICILNYAHERLKVPDHVTVKYEQVVCSLMQLSYHTHCHEKLKRKKVK